MKKISSFIILLFVAIGYAMAQQMPPIEFNSEVRRGKLDNGLTYYILKNKYPEKRASYYIAQRVGSIQEDDDQRGLAHFLEHMAFNGSEHFKNSDAIVEYCRSIGCSFGGELNAYTSTDETVYRVCNVPTERTEVTDSVILILKDWANGLTLAGEEIDKERGVIHEEWRLSTSATMRMFERNLPVIYPNSKYGYRMPIGIMEVVDNFPHDVLRNYYKKWYRPDNQAIIIVGDIDVDRTEGKIKELFASHPKAAADAPQVADEPVPDNDEIIVVVDKDKEMTHNIVMLCFKTDPLPRELRETMMAEVTNILTGSICSMVNERLAEAAQNPDCAFTAASLDYDNFIMSRTKECFQLNIIPKEGKEVEATTEAYRIMLRAFKAGFNDSEFQRAKDNIVANAEAQATNKDKIHNNKLSEKLYRHYLSGTAVPSPDTELQLNKMLCSQITVDALNQSAEQMVETSGKNIVLLSLNREAEGVAVPSADALKNAVLSVGQEQFEAYVDNAKNEPLVPVLPKAGKIVKKKKNPKYDATELTLSNGAKVIMKKTDFKADQIMFHARSIGGKSLYGKADAANFKVINDAVEASGLGNFDNQELRKALAGKKVSLEFQLSNQHEVLEGSSTPKDIETLMQLAYLYFTKINPDEKSFANIKQQYEVALKNIAINPDVAFSDSVTNTLHDYNYADQRIQIEDFKNINYSRCLQIAKERLDNAADFTFYFVGNYDEAQLKELICQYIGSLPGNAKKIEKAKPIDVYHKGVKENIFKRKMETPKANARIVWYNTTVPYSIENQLNAQAAGEVLEMIYLKEIREKESAAYSVVAGGNVRPSLDVPFTQIVGVCPFKPEKTDIALRIMDEELQKLSQTVDADMLAKVKENMLKKTEENLKTNGYWLNIMGADYEYGIDALTNTKAAINALSPESVANFVKNVILPGNKVKIVMLPEE